MAKTSGSEAAQPAELPTPVSDSALQTKLDGLRREMRQLIADAVANGESTDVTVRQIRDPFSTKNPHQIKAHPPGKVLSWKNPKYRRERGWRGWNPISYDDEIGRELSLYIIDPPANMAGSADLDNYVRRGTDSVLCWISEDVYLARQLEQSKRALEMEARAAMSGQIAIRSGVMITGDGGRKVSTGRDKSRREVEGELMGSREMFPADTTSE